MVAGNLESLIKKAKAGFSTLSVSGKYQKKALFYLKRWLSEREFKSYVPQIKFLIKQKKWDFLLDSFYQIIPFGTGGRRGLVGIGPNRINRWTIMSSAQGHSQFLVKKFGQIAKKRGVVLTYDVRVYLEEDIYDPKLTNPIYGLSCKDLAKAAAEVYAANGLKVYFFDDVRSTPELSFAIRHLGAIGGDMFSASHNPPSDNGKKVYDQFGGQLIPPADQELVNEVTQGVMEIESLNFKKAVRQRLIQIVGREIDKAYINKSVKISLSSNRQAIIAYTPLHGVGTTSVYKVLKRLRFKVFLDPKTSFPSPRFENVTFHIPNPEVVESFETSLEFAKKIKADILLSSDPDADRIGIMVNSGNNKWQYLNGQEIAVILTEYVISKYKTRGKLSPAKVIVKTDVTSSLISVIAKKCNIRIIGDLLVGYKYISQIMDELEREGLIGNFLFGAEESHGYISGNYLRDKDATIPAVWLSELAGELKENGQTLLHYLDEIYARYGYFQNYLTEIRLLGAEGMEEINKIQSVLRKTKPKNFGNFLVNKIWDRWEGPPQPHLSATDTASRNVLVFYMKPTGKISQMRITVRPSGTDPKIKMYFEIGTHPFNIQEIKERKGEVNQIMSEFERAFMKYCYKIIGIDFPDRGFLLFWQLPAKIKMRYFEIEKEIIRLRKVKNKQMRKKRLDAKLDFLGSDPIKKVDKAFSAKYGQSIYEYLNL
ncbi:MAG TPA: phospho-sugar mutase [Candidatus Bathyarchaeia archaeon]|nr:phospho-sugar mutase [Candidatus Bathyarchaeia archaeon]